MKFLFILALCISCGSEKECVGEFITYKNICVNTNGFDIDQNSIYYTIQYTLNLAILRLGYDKKLNNKFEECAITYNFVEDAEEHSERPAYVEIISDWNDNINEANAYIEFDQMCNKWAHTSHETIHIIRALIKGMEYEDKHENDHFYPFFGPNAVEYDSAKQFYSICDTSTGYLND